MRYARFTRKSSNGQPTKPLRVYVRKRPYENLTWEQYFALAKLVEKVDFKCNFKNGGCKSYPSRKGSKKEIRCCCNDCHFYAGYMDFLPEEALPVVKRLWDEDFGFWRKGRGCVLPYKYRSPICLVYSCSFCSLFFHPLSEAIEGRAPKMNDTTFKLFVRAIRTGLRSEGYLKSKSSKKE